MSRYDVFISYSTLDYRDAQNNVLPNNIITKIKELFDKNGISYWMDEEGLSAGDLFPALLEKNIKKCDCLLFISTHNSNFISKWTSKEIGIAIQNNKRLIPVKCDDSPFKEGIGLYFADIDTIDCTSGTEAGFKKIIKTIEDNRRLLKEAEDKRRKEEEKKELADKALAARKATIKKALADADVLLEEGHRLRKEISRLRGEYSTVSHDYVLNRNKLHAIVKKLSEINYDGPAILVPEDDFGLDVKEMAMKLDELHKIIEHLRSENEELKSEKSALKKDIDLRQISEIDTIRTGQQQSGTKIQALDKGHPLRLLFAFILGIIVAGIVYAICHSLKFGRDDNPETLIDTTLVVEEIVPYLDSTIIHGETCYIFDHLNLASDQLVDIGMDDVLWYSNNYGAKTPSDPGILVGWGDITATNRSTNPADYPSDSVIIGNPRFDISTKIGNNMRLPSKRDLDRLLDPRFNWKYGTLNGNYGYLLTGPNGNSIFLPLTNERIGERMGKKENWGCYWSGERHSSDRNLVLAFHLNGARAARQKPISFDKKKPYTGYAVRPVSDK